MRFRSEVLEVVESPMVLIEALAESIPDSLMLCYGESNLPTPDFIIRASFEAARAGHTF